MGSRDKTPVLRYLLALCLAACGSIIVGGCSKSEEPQQPQGTVSQPQTPQTPPGAYNEQKQRREKRGD